MRRSICTTDPAHGVAGEKRTWRFVYTPSNVLPKGTTLTFQMPILSKPIDWQMPSENLKSKKNVIWLQLPNGKQLQGKSLQDIKNRIMNFEFSLPEDVNIGENIFFGIGSLKDKLEEGNSCQIFTQRKKTFNLLINIKGKVENEAFHIDIKGNSLKKLKIITPSFVARNKRFDVIVRFEDEYGNLTNNTHEGTLVELSYENLRENLNWKLFIPETGFIALPNLYFNEAGIYKIQLKNLKTNEVFFSNPIKCVDESDKSIFWGIVHGESSKYSTSDNAENCFRYFRDEKAFQYYATSPFDSEKETTADQWKLLCQNVAEFNEDERFVLFLGQHWLGQLKEEGLRQFVFSKDNKSLLRKKDLKANALKKIYKLFSPKELISIPTFTMGSESVFDFKDFNEEFERVVEIYNAWGSSICKASEGNLRPISGTVKEDENGSILKALIAGCRFGFVAGALDDRGIYSSFFDTDQKQYSPGITAIVSKDQSREALFSALYNRSCYATTGSRILAGFEIANEPMGSEISTEKKPGLLYNRYISGYVVAPDKIKEVVIFRNGKMLKSFNPNAQNFEFAFDDAEMLSKICLNPNIEKAPFAFYYMRGVLEDGNIVWTSPIWIDMINNGSSKKVKKK